MLPCRERMRGEERVDGCIWEGQVFVLVMTRRRMSDKRPHLGIKVKPKDGNFASVALATTQQVSILQLHECSFPKSKDETNKMKPTKFPGPQRPEKANLEY